MRSLAGQPDSLYIVIHYLRDPIVIKEFFNATKISTEKTIKLIRRIENTVIPNNPFLLNEDIAFVPFCFEIVKVFHVDTEAAEWPFFSLNLDLKPLR